MTYERFDELRANAESATSLLSASDVIECLEEIARLAAAVYVPGQFKCPKCGFVLTKSIISVRSGTIGADRHCGESCPNDGSPMVPTTWEADARQMAESMPDAIAMRMVNELRADEGSSVTIVCDNPEGTGEDNCAVEVCGEWTKWIDHCFRGETVRDALAKARAAKARSSLT